MKSIYKSDEGRIAMEVWYERFLARIEERGQSVEHVTVATRFGDTNVVVGGPADAPPLVCFHGAMASAPAALVQIPQLLDTFRIYFPDTVGQPGRSDDTRLDWQGDGHGWWAADVLDGLEFERANIFGCSLGGYVAVRLMSVAPERVKRAVLWVPAGFAKSPVGPMLGLMWDGLVYNLRPSRARLEKILSNTFTDLDDDFVEFFAASLKHVHPDRRFPAVLPDGALQNFEGETMLIVNEHDLLFPPQKLLERARQEIPNLAREIECDGYSHMPPFAEGELDGLIGDIAEFVSGPALRDRAVS